MLSVLCFFLSINLNNDVKSQTPTGILPIQIFEWMKIVQKSYHVCYLNTYVYVSFPNTYEKINLNSFEVVFTIVLLIKIHTHWENN